MAWRSLFAIDNPNGRIGSQYTATINTSLAGNTLSGVQNVAYFTSLPIGVYSIAVSVPISTNTGGLEFILDGWELGVGSNSATNVLFPSTTLVPFPTTILVPLENTTSTIDGNFIISVTTSSSIYINSYWISGDPNNTIGFRGNPSFSSLTSCIATKLA